MFNLPDTYLCSDLKNQEVRKRPSSVCSLAGGREATPTCSGHLPAQVFFVSPASGRPGVCGEDWSELNGHRFPLSGSLSFEKLEPGEVVRAED